MAITLRGTPQTGSITNGGDVTLTFDVAPEVGDVVLVHGGHGETETTLTAPGSGYTEIFSRDTVGPIWGIWYKVMGATPDTDVVCSGGGNVNDAVGYVAWVLDGVDAAVLDAARTVASGVAAAVPNSPSITTVTDGAWVFSIAGTNATDSGPTITHPSGYSIDYAAAAADLAGFTTAGSYLEIATAGAEDPGAYSFFTRDDWDAVTVAIRPYVAPVGGGGGGNGRTGPGLSFGSMGKLGA